MDFSHALAIIWWFNKLQSILDQKPSGITNKKLEILKNKEKLSSYLQIT